MQPVKVRNVEIGSGMPKICVPIVGITRTDILSSAKEIRSAGADVVEWRADWYEDVFQFSLVTDTAKELRRILGEIPLLFTFRTAKEGGEKEITTDIYVALNRHAAQSGYIDLVDVEAFTGDKAVKEVIEAAHSCGVKVIVSNHDFHKTPEKDEIVSRLRKMQEIGADIPKIAVMPQSRHDVLTLLEATEEMVYKYADCPVITMSMAAMGAVSRICGEVFGSSLTFGTVGKASAPGQMEIGELRTILEILHNSSVK